MGQSRQLNVYSVKKTLILCLFMSFFIEIYSNLKIKTNILLLETAFN